jgi:hypothetical protein
MEAVSFIIIILYTIIIVLLFVCFSAEKQRNFRISLLFVLLGSFFVFVCVCRNVVKCYDPS